MSRIRIITSVLLIAFASPQAAVATFVVGTGTRLARWEPESDDERQAGELRKGDRQWGLVAGVGIAHEIWGGVADRQFLAIGGRWGRLVGAPQGPGFLKGNMELGVEVYPLFLMFQDPTTYGFAVSGLFRHYMAPNFPLRPFFTFGLGALVSVDRIPAESSHLNFATQVGLGIIWFNKPRLAYSFEYRLYHLSNAVLADVNPGSNSSYIQFTVSVFR